MSIYIILCSTSQLTSRRWKLAIIIIMPRKTVIFYYSSMYIQKKRSFYIFHVSYLNLKILEFSFGWCFFFPCYVGQPNSQHSELKFCIYSTIHATRCCRQPPKQPLWKRPVDKRVWVSTTTRPQCKQWTPLWRISRLSPSTGQWIRLQDRRGSRGRDSGK